MLWRWLASAFCLLWLSACIVVPLPPEHQTNVSDSESFKVGSTKKAEVISRLGTPALDAGKFLVYDDYAESWRYLFAWFIPAGYSGVGGASISPKTYTGYHLVCVFDESGVLTEYELTRDGERSGASHSAANSPLAQNNGVLNPGPAPTLISSHNYTSSAISFLNVALSPSGDLYQIPLMRTHGPNRAVRWP